MMQTFIPSACTPRIFFLLWMGIFPLLLFAQGEPAPAVEALLESLGREDDSLDPDDFAATLRAYIDKPLNLNKATEAQLAETGLLTALQISNFLLYRKEVGHLIALYELQAVPGFDSQSIQRVLPYFGVTGAVDDFQGSLGDMMRQSKKEVQIRWSRFAEPQQGYLQKDPAKGYQGDPNQLYVRLRGSYGQRLSYGLVAEKDRGEPFLKTPNPTGFDHYALHFYWERPLRWVQAVALGDYRISFGQGLLVYSGYGFGKSAIATGIKRGISPIRAATSAAESGFMRGAALTLDLAKGLTLSPFYSIRHPDGNSPKRDSLGQLLAITGLGESGLHRTLTEMANKGIVARHSAGFTLQYEQPRFRVGFNGLHEQLSAPIQPTYRGYNQYYFRGSTLQNLSVDFTFRLRNVLVFGETARSRNGAIATINGLLLALNDKIDVALLHRILPPNYQALDAAPFAEGSSGRNEQGLYAGIAIRPTPNWIIQAYSDLWRHPWLRYTADGPSTGSEYRVRIDFEQRRKMKLYVELRFKSLEQNSAGSSTQSPILAPESLFLVRLHSSQQLNRKLELRTRLDLGRFYAANTPPQRGWVVLQDILYKPIQSPLSGTARFALFKTAGYDIRFYEYENDMLHSFSIAPYYNHGIRWYLNLRYRPLPNLTMETRIAQTRWFDEPNIGSGLDAFLGPVKTQLGAQFKLTF